MDAIERDLLMNTLKRMIEKNTLGSAEEIAFRIGVSRRTVFRLIDHLEIREQLEIKYSKKENYYFFEKDAL